jgi:cysteine desulfurase
LAGADPIYLDHNATTPIDPRVLEAMVQVWRDCGANPASQHASGRRARRYVEESREAILCMLGARTTGMAADRLVFTSGGTEANQLALRGLLEALPDSSPMSRCLAISRLEHPSIQGTAEQLRREGVRVELLPVTPTGVVDVESFRGLMQRAESLPQVVSVMLASNETGVIQPVREIAEIASAAGVLVHSDAVQAIGKLAVNFRELGIAALTMAAHKLHGPVGIGGLLIRHDVQLAPQMFGGFQQGSLRPGTESAPLAVGFCRALELWEEERSGRVAVMQQLRDHLQACLQEHLPESVVIGADALRTPQTLCIAFPPLDRQALVMALDLVGVACSTGSACASGSSEPSPTLLAMGLPERVVQSAIRLSLGAFTTAAEASLAASRIIKTIKQLQHAR